MTATTYTVAELTRHISNALNDAFADDVWVTGQISGLTRSRGHVYFDLVEQTNEPGQPTTALISVALFKANKEVVNRTLKRLGMGRIEPGVRVRIRGAVSFTERNGRLQLRMTGIDPAYTLGQQALDRARLLHLLGAEGLLERNAALQMPLVPLRVGLVTSAGSAAYHDFVHELRSSGFSFHVQFIDAKVQGMGAGEQVMRALRHLGRLDLDVVAIVRGGGSRADLATFDSEQLARTIAFLGVPVITGVGHEVDRSIADEVAHAAYKTPTSCAAALVVAVRTYQNQIEGLWQKIDRVASVALGQSDDQVRAHAQSCARSVGARLRGASIDADNLGGRVAREATHSLARAEHRIERRRDRAAGAAHAHVVRGQAHLEQAARTVRLRAPRELTATERQLDLTEARLRALDPTRLLARGWTITRRDDGTLVRSTHDITPGATLVTRVVDGDVRSIVEGSAPIPEVDRHG